MRNVPNYNTCVYLSQPGDRSMSHDIQWLQPLWCGLVSLPGDQSMNHMTHNGCVYFFIESSLTAVKVRTAVSAM